jgi:hypothetical protein
MARGQEARELRRQKIPKPKIQNPNKLQIPNSKSQRENQSPVLEFEALEFVWDLGFGFWIFPSAWRRCIANALDFGLWTLDFGRQHER